MCIRDRYFHRSTPVLAFKAYTLLSVEPTYTTPLATAGEDQTSLPVVYFHRSAPVLVLKAYTLLSKDPTYTTPLATAGPEMTASPVVYFQRRPRFTTVAGLRTNSYGLKPVWQGTKPTCAQSITDFTGGPLQGRLGGGMTCWAVAIEPVIMSRPKHQVVVIFTFLLIQRKKSKPSCAYLTTSFVFPLNAYPLHSGTPNRLWFGDQSALADSMIDR